MPMDSFQAAIPGLLTLIAALTAAIVSIIQAVQSKARSAAISTKVDQVSVATTGLSKQVDDVSGQATLAAAHALATSDKVDEVAVQTNGNMAKMREELAAMGAHSITLQVENTGLRQTVERLASLLHERGQARMTDRIATATAEHQQTLDTANSVPIKVEITKIPTTGTR
jgi:hypothetical protein